jgi:hypothetical protein
MYVYNFLPHNGSLDYTSLYFVCVRVFVLFITLSYFGICLRAVQWARKQIKNWI